MQDYQRCEEVDAAYPQCVRHLAFIYLFLGRRDDALRLYEGMLSRDGFIGGRTAFVRLGRLNHKQANVIEQGLVPDVLAKTT